MFYLLPVYIFNVHVIYTTAVLYLLAILSTHVKYVVVHCFMYLYGQVLWIFILKLNKRKQQILKYPYPTLTDSSEIVLLQLIGSAFYSTM